MLDPITSTKNPLVQRFKSLQTRRGRVTEGVLLVEGEVMIREALQSGLAPLEALVEAGREAVLLDLTTRLEGAGARVHPASRHVLEASCDTQTPSGICCTFAPPAPLDLRACLVSPEWPDCGQFSLNPRSRSAGIAALFQAESDAGVGGKWPQDDRFGDARQALKDSPARLIALDGVQDPGNAGTIWRTADAAGFQGMLFGSGSADMLSPKVVRGAMGSSFRLPAAQVHDLPCALQALRDAGWDIVVTSLSGDNMYARPAIRDRFVLVIGSEARGVSPATDALSTVRLKLPMRGGAESLNAAVAAGIIMYELTRGL